MSQRVSSIVRECQWRFAGNVMSLDDERQEIASGVRAINRFA